MAELTLSFDIDVNISAQVGDTLYYCSTIPDSGFTVQDSDLVTIGPITKIGQSGGNWQVTCNTVGNISTPNRLDFILFSKDNAVNMSSPLGYYAKVKFVNDSLEKGELFAAACEIFESSK